MQKFKLYQLERGSNVFLIISEESQGLPLIVYGIIKVQGKSYLNSSCSCMAISNEVNISQLSLLEQYAKDLYFLF